MTAAHHIAAAERALATDQPNLAMLHMERASEEVWVDRLDIRADYFFARRQQRA